MRNYVSKAMCDVLLSNPKIFIIECHEYKDSKGVVVWQDKSSEDHRAQYIHIAACPISYVERLRAKMETNHDTA